MNKYILLPLMLIAGAAEAQQVLALPAKIRVFVGESQSFYASSFGLATRTSASSSSVAGTERWTIPVMKALHDKCPALTIVNKPDDADYFVRVDRNGSMIRHTEMAVFNKSGEMVFAASSASTPKEAGRFCKQVINPPKPKKK